jgi:hypothetical protein
MAASSVVASRLRLIATGQLEPLIGQAAGALAEVGHEQTIGVVLADGGDWNNAHITALGAKGMNVIIPTRSASRTKARKLSPKQGPEAERNATLG